MSAGAGGKKPYQQYLMYADEQFIFQFMLRAFASYPWSLLIKVKGMHYWWQDSKFLVDCTPSLCCNVISCTLIQLLSFNKLASGLINKGTHFITNRISGRGYRIGAVHVLMSSPMFKCTCLYRQHNREITRFERPVCLFVRANLHFD